MIRYIQTGLVIPNPQNRLGWGAQGGTVMHSVRERLSISCRPFVIGSIALAWVLGCGNAATAVPPTLADLLEASPTPPAGTAEPDRVRDASEEQPKDTLGATKADGRLPVPTAPIVKAAIATVRDVFKTDLAGAKTSDQLISLSGALVAEADKTGKTAEKWALLQQALELAVASGSLDAGEQVVARMTEVFRLDERLVRAELLTQFAVRPRPEFADSIALACLKDARSAAASGDVNNAKKLLGIGQGVARKSRNNGVIAQFKEAYTELRVVEKAAQDLKSLQAKYQANPTDRQASLDLGRHYCFIRKEWNLGLPLLAKGDDPELAQLATADLATSNAPGATVAAADAWLQWAQKQKGTTRDAASGHAVDLYAAVRTKLDGLERTRVEKRIQEAAAIQAAVGQKIWLADVPHQSVSGLAFGLTKDGTYRGKPYTCGGQPCGKSLLATPGGGRPAIIIYAVPPGVKRVIGLAGVFVPEPFQHMPNLKPATPQNFEIRLDGRTIWKSRPIANCNEMLPFDAVVAGGSQLELVTTTEDGNSAYAAWIEPFFVH